MRSKDKIKTKTLQAANRELRDENLKIKTLLEDLKLVITAQKLDLKTSEEESYKLRKEIRELKGELEVSQEESQIS